MGHIGSAVCAAIGILCVISVIRKRKYQKLGQKDPLKPWVLGTLSVLGCIAAVLFVNLLIH